MGPLIALLSLLGTVPAPAPGPAPARVAIQRVVHRQMAKIAACFEADGLTTTRVEVDFTIGANGRVVSTRTTSAGSRSLQRCVADVFSRLTFPASSGPVLVHYPVQICPAGQ